MNKSYRAITLIDIEHIYFEILTKSPDLPEINQEHGVRHSDQVTVQSPPRYPTDRWNICYIVLIRQVLGVIDESKLPLVELRPYNINEVGDDLVIEMHRQFDQFEHANWAHQIVSACSNNYSSVIIDMSALNMVNSTFIGGLLIMRDTLQPIPIRLTEASDKIKRVLEIMHCADFSVSVTTHSRQRRSFIYSDDVVLFGITSQPRSDDEFND